MLKRKPISQFKHQYKNQSVDPNTQGRRGTIETNNFNELKCKILT